MKNKIYDFGKLGKWSEDTILSNINTGGFITPTYVLNLIEEKYAIDIDKLSDEIEELGNQKIYVKGFKRHIKVKDVVYEQQNIHKLLNDKISLNKDYNKYETIMSKLFEKYAKKVQK